MKGIFLLFCYFTPTLHSSLSTYSSNQTQWSGSNQTQWSGSNQTQWNVTISTSTETISATIASGKADTNISNSDSISISYNTTKKDNFTSQTKFPNTTAISPIQRTPASFVVTSTIVSRGNTTVTSNGTGSSVSTSKETTDNLNTTLKHVSTSPSTIFPFSPTNDSFRATSQSIKSASTVHTMVHIYSSTATTLSQNINTTTTHSSYSTPSVSVTSHAPLSSTIINSNKSTNSSGDSGSNTKGPSLAGTAIVNPPSFTVNSDGQTSQHSAGDRSNTTASSFKGSMTLPQPTRSLAKLFTSSSINQRPGSSGKTSGSRDGKTLGSNGETTSKHSSSRNKTIITERNMTSTTATTTASMKIETISANLAIVRSVNSSNTKIAVRNQLLSSSSTASSQNELSSRSNAGTQSFLRTQTIVYTNTTTLLSTKTKQVAKNSSMMASSMVKQTTTTNKINIMISSTPSLEPSNAVPVKMMSSTIKPSIFIQPAKTTTVMMTSLTMTLHTNTTTVPTTVNITLWPSTTPSTTTVTTTVNITLLPTTVSTTQKKVESTSSSRDNTIYTPSSSVASGQCPCSSRTWKYPEDCRNMCCAGGYINATRVCMMNSVAITDSLCGKNRTSEMPCGKVNECACKGSQLSSFSYMAVTFLALVVWR